MRIADAVRMPIPGAQKAVVKQDTGWKGRSRRVGPSLDGGLEIAKRADTLMDAFQSFAQLFPDHLLQSLYGPPIVSVLLSRAGGVKHSEWSRAALRPRAWSA